MDRARRAFSHQRSISQSTYWPGPLIAPHNAIFRADRARLLVSTNSSIDLGARNQPSVTPRRPRPHNPRGKTKEPIAPEHVVCHASKSRPQAPILPNAPIALPLLEESGFEADGMPLFGGTAKLSRDTGVHFLEPRCRSWSFLPISWSVAPNVSRTIFQFVSGPDRGFPNC
jgi:hypothetical protein